jgi:meiotic recombination protein SPO11
MATEAEPPAWDALAATLQAEGTEAEEASGESTAAEARLDAALPAEVARRIEACALHLVRQLAAGVTPALPLGEAADAPVLALRGGRAPESADRLARLAAVLAEAHAALRAGGRLTLRALMYRLKTLETFSSPSHHAQAVTDATRLLRVPRGRLGLVASSKGLVAGRLAARCASTGARLDASTTPGGAPLGGDAEAFAALEFSTDAHAVLIVEKDAVFQLLAPALGALAAGGLRALLVTGKGVPDRATRAFLAALAAARPALPLLGLADWNPAGAGILALYRYGTAAGEGARHALPGLRWLGVRGAALAAAPPEALQALTPRDRAVARRLAAALRGPLTNRRWAAEVEAMAAAGAKAEVEAVYAAVGGAEHFPAALADAVARGDYV